MHLLYMIAHRDTSGIALLTADVKTAQYTDATGVVDKKWKCSYQNTTADKDVIIH